MTCGLPRARALARVDVLGAARLKTGGNVSYAGVDRVEVDRGGGERERNWVYIMASIA